MQTLVAVRFRHRQPVAQSLGVALIHVGDDGKGLPAERHLLHAVGSRSLVFGRLDDDADGEQVVDALELAFLLLHLLPDGVYALGAPLHVELQPGLLQPLLDWRDELADVGVAAFLRGIQLFLYHVVGVVLHVFQRQVFQLALQLVESQLVGQRGIQVVGLLAHLQLGLLVFRVAYLPHQVHAVGYHNQNHAHVFGKREQQVPEVLALDDGVLLVKVLYAHQSVDDGRSLAAEGGVDFLERHHSAYHAVVEQDGQHPVALQSLFLNGQYGRLQTLMDGIQTENVALDDVALQRLPGVAEHLLLVALLERSGQQHPQLLQQLERFGAFCLRKNQFFLHAYCYFIAKILIFHIKKRSFQRK